MGKSEALKEYYGTSDDSVVQEVGVNLTLLRKDGTTDTVHVPLKLPTGSQVKNPVVQVSISSWTQDWKQMPRAEFIDEVMRLSTILSKAHHIDRRCIFDASVAKTGMNYKYVHFPTDHDPPTYMLPPFSELPVGYSSIDTVNKVRGLEEREKANNVFFSKQVGSILSRQMVVDILREHVKDMETDEGKRNIDKLILSFLDEAMNTIKAMSGSIDKSMRLLQMVYMTLRDKN